MLTLQLLRDQTDRIIEGFRKRQLSEDQINLVQRILTLDEQRKKAQFERDNELSRINNLSKEIGNLMQRGDREIAEQIRKEVTELKESSKKLDVLMEESSKELEDLLITLPNVPHVSVPNGKDAEDNEVFQAGPAVLPELGESAQPHWELAKQYQIFDLEMGVKLTGGGFPVFRGKGAKLQRALISFFLDRATEAGFVEFVPPLMVNQDSARGTGQLPDKEAQMYYVERDDLYLIPTAEVPVTNIYRDEIVKESDLPIKMTAYTPCFRREAGSYGAHVRGLNRVHQFDKVEIVVVEHPDKSYDTLMEMVNHVKTLMEALELPYRILRLCGGDMGFASALTFDFEVWSAAQQRWLEVSSVSNFETFQSNRLKLRYRDENGRNLLAHTLNGSALALPRILAALIENNQTPEGIVMPAVLRPYTGFDILN